MKNVFIQPDKERLFCEIIYVNKHGYENMVTGTLEKIVKNRITYYVETVKNDKEHKDSFVLDLLKVKVKSIRFFKPDEYEIDKGRIKE